VRDRRAVFFRPDAVLAPAFLVVFLAAVFFAAVFFAAAFLRGVDFAAAFLRVVFFVLFLAAVFFRDAVFLTVRLVLPRLLRAVDVVAIASPGFSCRHCLDGQARYFTQGRAGGNGCPVTFCIVSKQARLAYVIQSLGRRQRSLDTANPAQYATIRMAQPI